jgi:hypothetical protein
MALVLLLALALAWLSGPTRVNRAAIRTVQELGGFSDREGRLAPATPPKQASAVSPPGRLRARIAGEFINRLPVVSLDGARLSAADLAVIGRAAGLQRLYLNGTSVDDTGLWHLRGLNDLRVLELSETQVGDAGIGHLAGLRRLEKLLLYQTSVGDAVGIALKGMQRLEVLRLGRTAVGDAALEPIGGLERLRELGLQHTRVTDAGLVHLARLARLEVLDLTGTSVTDAGLRPLASLPNLHLLIVVETQVTEQGVAALQAALPALRVLRSGGRAPDAGRPPLWYPGRLVPDCSPSEDASEGEHASCTTTREA